MASSFLITLASVHSIVANYIPVWVEGRDIVIVGRITSLPIQTSAGTRFNFSIDRLYVDSQQSPITGLVRLNWYGQGQPGFRGGERWQLKVRLKHPHGLMSPGTFDYEDLLLQNHIIATGYIRDDPDNVRLTRTNDRRSLIGWC